MRDSRRCRNYKTSGHPTIECDNQALRIIASEQFKTTRLAAKTDEISELNGGANNPRPRIFKTGAKFQPLFVFYYIFGQGCPKKNRSKRIS